MKLRLSFGTMGDRKVCRGYNDDLVIALAIACWIRDTALTVNQRDVEQRKSLCLQRGDLTVVN